MVDILNMETQDTKKEEKEVVQLQGSPQRPSLHHQVKHSPSRSGMLLPCGNEMWSVTHVPSASHG